MQRTQIGHAKPLAQPELLSAQAGLPLQRVEGRLALLDGQLPHLLDPGRLLLAREVRVGWQLEAVRGVLLREEEQLLGARAAYTKRKAYTFETGSRISRVAPLAPTRAAHGSMRGSRGGADPGLLQSNHGSNTYNCSVQEPMKRYSCSQRIKGL